MDGPGVFILEKRELVCVSDYLQVRVDAGGAIVWCRTWVPWWGRIMFHCHTRDVHVPHVGGYYKTKTR